MKHDIIAPFLMLLAFLLTYAVHLCRVWGIRKFFNTTHEGQKRSEEGRREKKSGTN